MKTKVLVLFAMFGFTAFFSSCTKEEIVSATEGSDVTELTEKNAPGTQPIAQIAIDAGFSELVSALAYVDAELDAGLVNLFLNGTDQYTVFAPTNQAFLNLYAALGVDSIDDLPADLVLDVLLYHVVEGRRSSNSVVPKRNTRNISTLLGVNFTVNPQAQITAIGNTSNIVAADISASNGVIHVIDAVILPIN